MGRMDGKVSIITGAASGMGKEMALLFLEEGGHVVAADINQDRLNELDEEMSSVLASITMFDVVFCVANCRPFLARTIDDP